MKELTQYEQKEIEVNEYLKEKHINAMVTNIGKNGFTYMLSNGQEWYLPYNEM